MSGDMDEVTSLPSAILSHYTFKVSPLRVQHCLRVYAGVVLHSIVRSLPEVQAFHP